MRLRQPFGLSIILLGVALVLSVRVARTSGGTLGTVSLGQETETFFGALVASHEVSLYAFAPLRAQVNVDTPVLGDVSGDTFVDEDDVDVINLHYFEMGPPPPPGDANSDNIVDIFDVNVVSANWAPNPIPEPASIALLALSAPGLWWIRRKLRG